MRPWIKIALVFIAFCDRTSASLIFTTIDVPGLTSTLATDINDNGQIVGFFGDSGGVHGFLDTGGSFLTLDHPAATPGNTNANGVNAAGTVVGYYSDNPSSGSGDHGFTYSGGTCSGPIDDPSATSGTQAYGINDAGSIVGTYVGESGTEGFLDIGGAFTTIQDPVATNGTHAFGINNAGVIVGEYSDGTGVHGFIDNGGVFTTLDDPNDIFGTGALGINNAGQVVGLYADSGSDHAFLYSNGVFTNFDDPAGLPGTSFGAGINDLGQIVAIRKPAWASRAFSLIRSLNRPLV